MSKHDTKSHTPFEIFGMYFKCCQMDFSKVLVNAMDYGLLGFFLSWMRAYMQWQNLEQRLSLVLDGPVTIKGRQGMDFHAVKPPEEYSES